MEVLSNGTWGTVCDVGWDMKDANVVCRGLGYGTALAATTRAWFGRGCGDIHMAHVQCNGSESSLLNCGYGPGGESTCFHYQDAGVICSGKTKID